MKRVSDKVVDISAARIARAYAEVMKGTDHPDVIYFSGPRCPHCKADWYGVKSKCDNCGWPEVAA